jgi:hypothetical protein
MLLQPGHSNDLLALSWCTVWLNQDRPRLLQDCPDNKQCEADVQKLRDDLNNMASSVSKLEQQVQQLQVGL